MSKAPVEVNVALSNGLFTLYNFGFIDTKLSKLLCGFREGYSSQDALFRVNEQCYRILDRSGKVGTVLMYLSKAYDCIPCDLLLAKLEAYCIGLEV